MMHKLATITVFPSLGGIPPRGNFSFHKGELEATIIGHKNEEYITILDNKLTSNDASQSIQAQAHRH